MDSPPEVTIPKPLSLNDLAIGKLFSVQDEVIPQSMESILNYQFIKPNTNSETNSVGHGSHGSHGSQYVNVEIKADICPSCGKLDLDNASLIPIKST